jgi:acyl-CoA synthetase (AMP-forming)/AMP-acid ligase II
VGFAFTGDPAAPVARLTSGDAPAPADDQAASLGEGDEQTALQLLSSGTTGTPKRISLTRKSVDDMIEQTIAQYELAGPAGDTVSIMPWPLSSLGGSNASLPAAALDQKLVIQERFDAPAMLELIKRHRPAMLSLAPASFGMILQLDPAKEDLASIRMIHTGAAPLDPNVHARLEDEYGIPVLLMYGATEFAGIICGWGGEEMAFLGKKRGSVGRPRKGMRLRVVSPDGGEPLPTGEYGLVQAIVPRIGPDWVTTTDVGMIDEDGFLFLQGRADDVIIRGGFKVLPDEVADLLRLHPQVGDAAVIGVADDRLGAVPGAVIERAAGRDFPTEAELLGYLREHLPSYKVPARFAFVESLPRTPTMKPQRQGLLEALAAVS